MKGAGALPLLTKAGEMGLAETAEVTPRGLNGSTYEKIIRKISVKMCQDLLSCAWWADR